VTITVTPVNDAPVADGQSVTTAEDTAKSITLTAADTIIWYAPVTSAETYLQANARIDRQGQQNAMTVVHIVGSQIETKIYRMLREKLGDHTKLIDLYREELTQ
jgi:SNF2 family DNA or RNA helicase